jgi:hypothetical protein
MRSGFVKCKTVREGTLEIAKNAFDKREMRLTRIMHVKAYLLDSIGDVRTSEGGIL